MLAMMNEKKTTNPVNTSLEMPRLLKVSLNSSIRPVMTHSRPPMALSMPSMMSIKKKMTDQNWLLLGVWLLLHDLVVRGLCVTRMRRGLL